MYYRKLNLTSSVADKFLKFVNDMNEKILNMAGHQNKWDPVYWYVTTAMNGYFYGYQENNIPVDKNIGVTSWDELKLDELSDINFFKEFELLNMVFTLFKHNFPIHRHGEWLPGSTDYYRHVLVASMAEGELKLCKTDWPEFFIEPGDVTHIDHLPDNDKFNVEKTINLRPNDIFVFDASTWHTFTTEHPLSRDFFTTTFILNRRNEDQIEKLCDRLEELV